MIVNDNIEQYLRKVKRSNFCGCTDGCQSSRRCSCYVRNSKLQNPTYDFHFQENSTDLLIVQPRALSAINKVFTFNECSADCKCNKDLCSNYLLGRQNLKRFQLLIKRVAKTTKVLQLDPVTAQETEREVSVNMWGLFALENIPAGAFLMEYRGEIVTKKHGDMRGTFYDSKCLSYLFDMNDLEPGDKREQQIQQAYNEEFFPLCLDAMFYGNEARFINHSCDPNVQSFNLAGQANSQAIHNIGLFASRTIKKGEELNLDYQWDKNELAIKESVPCLCGSFKCRGFLMRARKPKPAAVSRELSV